MVGFYTKYWSTLLKGPSATRIKLRFEIKRTIKFSNMASNLLFHKFKFLIEKEHRVSYFLKELRKFVTYVKKTGNNCFQVLFNESTQDMSEFREVHAILQEIGEFWQKVPRLKILKRIELDFLLHILNVLKDDELKEREEYKLVLAVVNEAATKDDHQKLMAMIRDRFKSMGKTKLQNLFERMEWRREARITKKEIDATKIVKKELWKLLYKLSKERDSGKLEQLAGELKIQLDSIKVHVGNMFKESYLVKERAILMVLRIIYIVDYADKWLKLEEERNLIPKQQTEEGLLTLKEAMHHLGKDFNKSIAQEFRIVIHDIEELEKEAKILEAQM